MPITVDPQFSVFRMVERVQQQSTLLNHRQTMNLISYEIENASLIDRTRTRVFAGFQRMSRFLPQVKRYTQLAKLCEVVYVFGVPDVTPPELPNVHYVPLSPDAQLAREWFLVSYGRDYRSALATEEQTHIDDPDHTRLFKGIWTFEPPMVFILYEWLSQMVDEPLQVYGEQDVNREQQIKLMSNGLARVVATMNAKAKYAIIESELRTLVRESMQPILARMTSG